MRVLLDTNALVWALVDSPRLSATAREVLRSVDNQKLVSASSCWEIATKVRLGKWDEAASVELYLLDGIRDAGFFLLPVDGQIALRAGRLSGLHRDPFDRILASHAMTENVPILTPDEKLDSFGVQRIW